MRGWLAAAVHGQGKGPDWAQGAWLPDGHGRPGYLHNTPPAVVTVPDGGPGQTLSLFAPGHTLENVQVLHPPGLEQSLPMGLVGFSVTGVPVGGTALVQMTLPVGMTASNYYKTDPATGQITPFDFDGRTGAQSHGNVITLHLRDGGPGDADGLANGVIVDPGGPGLPTLKHTVIVPAATTAELVTLQSPVYNFATVQTLDPPTTGVSLPLGLFRFNVVGAIPGAAATVTMTLTQAG